MSESRQISLPAKIEAILYLKGRPTSSKEMAELLDKDIAEIEKALWELKAGYAQRDTSLEINENKSHYSLELRQGPVSYTHLRAHETLRYLVCRLLLDLVQVTLKMFDEIFLKELTRKNVHPFAAFFQRSFFLQAL